MVNKEVLVGHRLGGVQVVGIQRGKELYYGTEAQDWGTGTILIYKIDVWQILDFRRRCLRVPSVPTPSTQNSQLEKYQKGHRISLLLIGFRKLQRRVSLAAESAESTFKPVHASGGKSVGRRKEDVWQNPSAVHNRC